LESLPPTSEQITLVEAVGRGDLAALTELASQHTPEEMDRPLPAGLTLIQLAVKMQQPAAVQWLVDHGATLDILSARDLGWRERIPGLLKAHPELANRPVDENGATALHIAALENDVELVKMLLEGGADPTIEDHYFHSTPLGWAKYNHSLAAVELIEAHQKE
jgi:ankyrin repeat protein